MYTSASRSVFKLPRVIARGVSCPKFLAMTRCIWFFFLLVIGRFHEKSSDDLLGSCEFGLYFSRLVRVDGQIFV